MNKLELVKKRPVGYVDLEVLEVGKIYYIVDVAESQSIIAVCLSIDQDKAIFKIMEYLTGDWSFITDHNLFPINRNNLFSAAHLHIFPVTLNYMIDPWNMKISIHSEIKMY